MLVLERRERRAVLQRECAELESNVEQLQQQIADLHLQVLQGKMAVEQKKREMASFAPVYALPDDVVAEILKFAFQHEFPHCRLDDGLPHTNSPVAISHVSRWWRRQAVSLPQIWTCIHVTPGQPSGYAEVIKAYLLRSRELPLSISFQCFACDGKGYHVGWQKLRKNEWSRFKASWKYLVTQKYRWKNCSLYLWHEESARAIIPSLKGRLPQLELLSISLGMAESTKTSLSGFEAPKLTELRAEGLFRGDLQLALAPQEYFSRLTDLKLDAVSCKLGDIMRVLAQAAETLEHLCLFNVDVTRERSHNASHLPSPTFSKLKHLILGNIIDFEREDYNLSFRLCLAAVSLETLSVRDPTLVSQLCKGRLLLPTLRCLDISKVSSDADIDPRNLFLATPNIETLRIVELEDMAKWVSKMTEMDASGSGAAWPHLHSLTLLHAERADVRAFVEHRAAVKRLIRTVILGSHSMGALTLDDLDFYRNLKVKVTELSDAPPEVRAAYMQPDDWWDYKVDKPMYIPWKGSLVFDDQYELPEGRDDSEDDEYESDEESGDEYQSDEEDDGDEYRDEDEDED